MFSESSLEQSFRTTYVIWSNFISSGSGTDWVFVSFVYRKINWTFWTSPEVNCIFRPTWDWWCDVMSVTSNVTCDGGGRGGRVGALGALSPGGICTPLPPGGGPVRGAGWARICMYIYFSIYDKKSVTIWMVAPSRGTNRTNVSPIQSLPNVTSLGFGRTWLTNVECMHLDKSRIWSIITYLKTNSMLVVRTNESALLPAWTNKLIV